jgi:PAS domain S-box-containing protein
MGSMSDSDDKYRILVEQASDGIAIYDKDGRLMEVNTRACEVLGYSREELIGRNVSDLIAPENLAEMPLRYEALRSGQPLLGERVLVRKDGTSIPVELSARMLSDGRYQVIARDITQRKVLEEEIRRSRDYYLTLLEDFPALIWQTDTEAKANYFNHTWLNFRGRTLEEEIGDGWMEGIHPDDLAHCLDVYLTAFHARQPFVAEYRLRRYDGEYRWIRDQGSAFMDLDGNFAGYLGSCYDITQQKNAREEIHRLNAELERRVVERTSELKTRMGELRAEIARRKRVEEEYSRLLQSEQEARREAESAVQVRDELLAIVSHDLKNPLAAIKGNSQLIRKRIANLEGPEIEKVLTPVSRVDEATTRMSVLINDLLDFGRLQAGQSLTLQRRPTDLIALVQAVVAEFQQTTRHHRIEAVTSLTRLMGIWDNMRLEQVLDNLVSNAIKYSPGGGVIRLNVGREVAEDGKSWAVLTVSDSGIGISAEDIPHIFEWFRRAKNASGRISGAGIGLASANYIVSQHGGQITVTSEPGKGATFTVWLPL